MELAVDKDASSLLSVLSLPASSFLAVAAGSYLTVIPAKSWVKKALERPDCW